MEIVYDSKGSFIFFARLSAPQEIRSMTPLEPVIGHWYRRGRRKLFEVVAMDDADQTIELQHFDGTVEEMELANWPAPLLEEVGAPEDWSGSVDMSSEDTPDDDATVVSREHRDPLLELEND